MGATGTFSWRGAIMNPGLIVPALGVALSLALSMYAIDTKSIWGDEALSIDVATASLGRFVRTVILDEPFAGLYYVLLRGWIVLWGSGEAAVRSLSAIFVAAAIPPIFSVGRRISGLQGGIFATALALSNSFVIHYSQDSRAYGLAYFLAALSAFLVIKAVGQPARSYWLAYAVVAVLAAYAHAYAVFVLVAQLGWAVWSMPTSRRLPLRIAGAVGVALLPLAAGTAAGPARQWIEVTPQTVGQALLALTGSEPLVSVSPLLSAGYALGLGLAAFWMYRAWRSHQSGAAKAALMLAASVLVPLGASIGISLAKPVLVDRYLLVTEPALIVLAALGVARVRVAWLSWGFAVLLVGAGFLQVSAWYRSDINLDFRGAARHILTHGDPGDGVLVFPPAKFKSLALEYYLDGLPATGPRPRVESISGVRDPDRRVRRLRAHHDRIWLVLWGPVDAPTPVMERWLNAFHSEFDGGRQLKLPSLNLFLFNAGDERSR